MIHYALRCTEGHDFEGWFRSSDDFERQAERRLLGCPHCGSAEVGRALMAPAVVTDRGRVAVPAAAPAAPAAPSVPVALADPRAAALVEMLRDVRRRVEENADYVGDRFAEEARRIHYGESDQRGIYGEATGEEVSALLDEGVEIHPLPVLPEDRN